jgi:FixJ family two-component response regulator
MNMRDESKTKKQLIDELAKLRRWNIVSSGYSNNPILANFREHGFMGFIPKPYKVQELSEVLHRVITDVHFGRGEASAELVTNKVRWEVSKQGKTRV